MTRQDAFQRAKSSMLIAMSDNLKTDNVSNAILAFGAEMFDINTAERLDRINVEIDSLINRLNYLKVNVENAKQFLRDAE